MIRAYAIALAAGTQAITEGVGGAIFGTAGIRGDLAKASAWVINLAVAEWVIRRPARATRRAVGAAGRAVMTETRVYELRVVGRLDDRWAGWFDGLALDASDDGTSTLTGPVQDQAQLHGILARLRDLGVPLISCQALDR